jgi:hypothetical protein
VYFCYQPPTVNNISPLHGPTSGMTVGPLLPDGLHHGPGSAITMTITGTNLGTNGYVLFQATNPTDSNIVVSNSSILSHTDSQITFNMPAGYGDSLHVIAVIGGQISSPTQYAFVYDPPQVLGWSRNGMTPQACAPHQSCYSYLAGNETDIYCYTAPGECYDTISPPYYIEVC